VNVETPSRDGDETVSILPHLKAKQSRITPSLVHCSVRVVFGWLTRWRNEVTFRNGKLAASLRLG
jgi:hypothetical protein